jgi:hypothetical protein
MGLRLNLKKMEEENSVIVELLPQTHNRYLSAIRRLLGASFVGWVKEKEEKYLRIVINKKEIRLPFKGGDLITEESYKNLIKELLNSYGAEIQEPVRLDATEGRYK